MKEILASRKLLMSALKYEAMGDDNMDAFCEKLQEMGLNEGGYSSESTTLNFVESEPSNEKIVEVLNHLGYEIEA